MSIFTNYCTANHRLPTEVGRWENIPRSERKCYLCEDGVIGDEYHFLFVCFVCCCFFCFFVVDFVVFCVWFFVCVGFFFGGGVKQNMPVLT